MNRYPKLKEAQLKAKSLGLSIPHSSHRKGKKLVVVHNGKKIHFGQLGMEDYLIHRDSDRRDRFRARAEGILKKDGQPAYLDPDQPLYWSYNILW